MAIFRSNGIEIYYEVHGEGFPVLLIAPGGMYSAISFWDNAPWNPIEQLSNDYQVIAMDQRNAGRSTAPISGDEGWSDYTRDQLALLDHLGINRFHVAGMCIGGPYALGLIQAAPERVVSAVLFQPIGLTDNRQSFFEIFDAWANELKATQTEVTEAQWGEFRNSMFGSDRFLFYVDRDFVSACETPLLVLCGRDVYHPEATSREVAELARNADLIEYWKEGVACEAARVKVGEFLARNTPRG